MGHPDALNTIAYWWWFLQGLLLPILASLVSGPSAPYDGNPDDDDAGDNNPDCDSPDDDNPDRDLGPAGTTSYSVSFHQQVTSLTAEVRRVSQLIDETKGRSEEEGRESQRTVSQLESELESGERGVEALERELRQAEDTLTEMKTATQELFDVLQCDPLPIVAIVGGGEITSNSVSVYLSVVEQRVHEVLQLRQVLLADELPSGTAPLGEETQREDASDQSETSQPKVIVPLGKPQLPHTAHTNDEESPNGGPLTHGDILSNMRRFIPDSSDH
ncbi:uncharacterized protein LOC126999142 [Eriocheir sinensis]|uniref:uncharacterized protein LOC126999142 n=1 Tax=Eriocheir sinensis TaxID=95602 RepID=UPI0021C8DFB0|nr:uncharacterized protein LOC126999142 [Eriocheir sinensis]